MVLDYVGLEFKNKYDDVELIVISTAFDHFNYDDFIIAVVITAVLYSVLILTSFVIAGAKG